MEGAQLSHAPPHADQPRLLGFLRVRSQLHVSPSRTQQVNRSLHRDPKDWQVLIKDRHEGYISWEQFEGISA